MARGTVATGRLAKAGAKAASALRHRRLRIEGLSIHVVDAGAADQPAVVFLHGWPQNWAAFEPVMLRLSRQVRVVALDLPGIANPSRRRPHTTSALWRNTCAR